MKVEVTVTPRSFEESTADISVLSERVRGEGEVPQSEFRKGRVNNINRISAILGWKKSNEKTHDS